MARTRPFPADGVVPGEFWAIWTGSGRKACRRWIGRSPWRAVRQPGHLASVPIALRSPSASVLLIRDSLDCSTLIVDTGDIADPDRPRGGKYFFPNRGWGGGRGRLGPVLTTAEALMYCTSVTVNARAGRKKARRPWRRVGTVAHRHGRVAKSSPTTHRCVPRARAELAE